MDWKGLGAVFLALLIAGLATVVGCKPRVKRSTEPTTQTPDTAVVVSDRDPNIDTGVVCIDGHYCLIAQWGDGLAMKCPMDPKIDQQKCPPETVKAPAPVEETPKEATEETWPPKEK
jgi:hypothetical protein